MIETIGYPRYTIGPRFSINVGASPFKLTNPLDVPGEVFVSGGTVTLIEFSRDGAVWDSCGILGGQFRLNPDDSLRITYVLAPTVVAYPF